MAIRVVTVARDAELWARAGGMAAGRRGARSIGAATPMTRPWSTPSSPTASAGWPRSATIPCAAVLDAEPAPVRTIGG